jgi:hypothetical protein
MEQAVHVHVERKVEAMLIGTGVLGGGTAIKGLEGWSVAYQELQRELGQAMKDIIVAPPTALARAASSSQRNMQSAHLHVSNRERWRGAVTPRPQRPEQHAPRWNRAHRSHPCMSTPSRTCT